MTTQDAETVRRIVTYLFDETSWDCPVCHYGNCYRPRPGVLRLECKYCNDGGHPLTDVLAQFDGTREGGDGQP